MAFISLDSPSCEVPCWILLSVVYRDVTRQAKGLYRLKHEVALKRGLAYLSRCNSGWFCHMIHFHLFPFAVRTPSPITTTAPLLPSSEPLAAVDSRRRPPIAPTNPLASFHNPYSCLPAPKRDRISIGAPLPATAAHHRPLLIVEHPFPTFLDSN
jgi:hypothetical protein